MRGIAKKFREKKESFKEKRKGGAHSQNGREIGRKKRRAAILPLAVLLLLLSVPFLPNAEVPEQGTRVRVLSVPKLSSTLLAEQSGATINSAWLRSTFGPREIENISGMSFISSSVFLCKADADALDDPLWRASFMNLEGEGVHLWVGMLTQQQKMFITKTPFEYTRWDAVPAKLVVPKGTALYISPAIPAYDKAEETFGGKDSYTYIYTLRMTPDGPAFVPVPAVYRQLADLLRAGIIGEFNPMKRLAYVRMLDEFNGMAQGKPPRAESLLNFQQYKTEVLSWKN